MSLTPREKFKLANPDLYARLERTATELPETFEIKLLDERISTHQHFTRHDDFQSYNYTVVNITKVLEAVADHLNRQEFAQLIVAARKKGARVHPTRGARHARVSFSAFEQGGVGGDLLAVQEFSCDENGVAAFRDFVNNLQSAAAHA